MKVFDAAAKIKSLRIPDSVKTFKDYKMYFYSHIKSQTSNIARFDLIFDYYINSLKSTARAKRGSSISIKFRSETSLPKNWHGFLTNQDNKTALFEFLAVKDAFFDCHIYQDAVVTNGRNVLVLHYRKHQH